VLVPYTLGVELAGARLGRGDLAFAGSLYLLFVARIVLKDFRDRAGDAAYGKPTLLLRHGKRLTCVVSLVALAAGLSLMAYALHDVLPVVAVVVLGATVAGRLRALARASTPADEQVAIGIGARAGNGLLVCVLCWLLLRSSGADTAGSVLAMVLLTGAYSAAVTALVLRPEQVVIGYKG
jgi:4-hydroxybenzoate polyprenyltransferase